MTTNSSITEDDVTTVQCLSKHATSFAVLVDVAGGLKVRRNLNELAIANIFFSRECHLPS